MKGLFDTLKDTLGTLSETASKKVPHTKSSVGELLGAGAVGSIVGALLGGSKSVRSAAKNVATIGAGAAACAFAYSLLKKWQQNNNNSQTNTSKPSDNKNYQVAAIDDERALLLLQAMIFSARADGHIDDEEKSLIDKCSKDLANDTLEKEISNFLNCPLDPNVIAAKVSNQEQAFDIYVLSKTVIYCDNFMEESFINGLAKALNISKEQQVELDKKADSLRENLV